MAQIPYGLCTDYQIRDLIAGLRLLRADQVALPCAVGALGADRPGRLSWMEYAAYVGSMCGRYSITTALKAMRRLFKFTNDTPSLCCICIGSAMLLLCFEISAAAESRHLGSGDLWNYSGEVQQVSNGGPFCSLESHNLICAHGSGVGGTDGGEIYSGLWSNGTPHGFGTYESDELEYVGEFQNGRFHGKGTLECYRGGKYRIEGMFVDGNLDGLPKSGESGSRILLQPYPVCR